MIREIGNLITARRFICTFVVMVWLVSACQGQNIQMPESSMSPIVTSQTEWVIEPVHLARIQNNTVFVSNPPDYVAAFDLETGTFAWQKDDLDPVIGAPITTDGERLYVVTSRGVVAVDDASGAIQWQTSLPTDGVYHELAAIGEEQIVIYGDIHPFANNQVLYALGSQTGDIIWQVELPGSIDWYRRGADFQRHSAVAYDRGRIYLRNVWYIGGKSGILFGILALNAQSGTELWRFDFGVKQLPGEGPLFGADSLAFGEDLIYIPTYLGPLYAVNDFGALRVMIDDWWASPIRADDLIVAEVLRKGIVAIDQSTGAEIWTTSLEEEPYGIPQIVSLQDYLFVETSRANETHIAILELTSGERVGTIKPLSSSECSKPLVLDVCGDQLCLVTMNCIYQFSISGIDE